MTLNGQEVRGSDKNNLNKATVLAGRSEVNRGESDCFMNASSNVIRRGLVAYKLALVSAGLADATFTLVPKNEWNIAAGAFLIKSARGKVSDTTGKDFMFNQRNTLVSSLVASGQQLFGQLKDLLEISAAKN